MPLAGEGISVSTLSVETSTIPSSTSTGSPTPLSQPRTVPSVTDSPIGGKVIWTVVPVAIYVALLYPAPVKRLARGRETLSGRASQVLPSIPPPHPPSHARSGA